MKKIGIMSMQRIKNYGSFLQAYALKQIITDLGHEVQFVDYHIETPIIKDDSKKNNTFSKLIDILFSQGSIKQKIQYINHKKNFDKYFKTLRLTSKPNYNPKLDTLVIGSDEVFNCIQSNCNVGYSLELFGKSNNAKKVITYAASFGNTTIDKLKKFNKQNEIKVLLSKINSISVRDNNSGNIVRQLINIEPQYNLDPVLIFDYKNSGLIPNIKKKEKYMIVYAYAGRITKYETKYIKEYAKKNNLKVYAIGGPQKCADKFIDCSPFELLSYFKDAECIVTDTFHGTIFSIIMEKQFVTLIRKSIGNSYGNEEKLTDLLLRLKLEDRIIFNINELILKLKEKISYFETNNIIENNKIYSIDYLKKEL